MSELPRDLMRFQIAALFTHDAAGRMLRVNEPNGARAPRFFLGRTRQGNEWRVRDDVPDDLARELAAICAAEPVGDDHLVAPYGSPGYEQVLARAAPVANVWAGPAYRFPSLIPDAPGAVVITLENRSLLEPYMMDWFDDVGPRDPFTAAVVDGHAVSVCASVRVSPVAHEAGVDTHKDYRRHGYGSLAVAAWARAVRDIGCVPLYSTSWENVASQALARRLGLVRFGTDLHVT